MKIKKYVAGALSTNSYLVYKEGESQAFFIDPVRGYEKIKAFCNEQGIKVCAVLLTHGHFDHILEASLWQKDGAKIYIHTLDADKLYSDKNLAHLVRVSVPPCTADVLLNGGETLHIAGFSVEVIHTPGHSVGSVCYVLDRVIFSGDTLFKGDCGRTDFPDGSFQLIKSSIKDKLFGLEGDYRVLPGHGEETTLDEERQQNIILNYL